MLLRPKSVHYVVLRRADTMHVKATKVLTCAIVGFSINLILTLRKIRLVHHLLMLDERRLGLLATSFEALVLGSGAHVLCNRWLIYHRWLALLLEPALLEYVSSA